MKEISNEEKSSRVKNVTEKEKKQKELNERMLRNENKQES